MSDFKVGDLCRCKEHPACFFIPESVVLVTALSPNGSEECVSAKLLFGEYKDDDDTSRMLEHNMDDSGAVYCYLAELEKVDAQTT